MTMENSGLTTNTQPVNNINLNIAQGGGSGESKGPTKYVSVFKTAFDFIADAPLFKIIKFFTVVIVLTSLSIFSVFTYKFLTSEKGIMAIANAIEHAILTNEEEALSIRANTTPKIQKELSILCHSLHADRAFIFELHNGKKNSTGLPFKYADMTYEEINGEKNHDYVGLMFQDLSLTLYKFPHYLAEHKYIYDDVKSIAVVDNAFAKHIEKAGGEYIAMLYMTSGGVGVGFLCVSFHDKPEFNPDVIKKSMMKHGKIVSELLDLTIQREDIL